MGSCAGKSPDPPQSPPSPRGNPPQSESSDDPPTAAETRVTEAKNDSPPPVPPDVAKHSSTSELAVMTADNMKKHEIVTRAHSGSPQANRNSYMTEDEEERVHDWMRLTPTNPEPIPETVEG
eukprot:TRINITY_DN6830_c0_g1_i1.p1 TRINITY_DN6830_c0_g1~~TRINITY_DN6830_c0_g1_i1.p1  ORF type:complete len:122 (+),score=18.88 TRINITY_DN6830_c0_g1_i1:97-462(+)